MEARALKILAMKEDPDRLEVLGILAEIWQQAATISVCVVSKISST